MEVWFLFQRSSRSLPLIWVSSWLDRLQIMLRQMDKLKHPIRALSSWLRERLMSTLDVGTRSYQRHCGHTIYLFMGREKLPLIT
jgi:hypothetical protein